MTAQPTAHDLLIVACPKCHAEAASPCVTSTGKKSPVHSDRVKAASEAAAAKAKRTKRTCTVCGVRLTARNNNPANNSDLCDTCFEQAGWENDHQDGNHKPGSEMDRCPMCNPDIVPTHSDRSWFSHAGCDHPSTKAARAACRRERANSSKERIADNATDSRKAAIRAKKPAARKMAAGLA
jgi:hypothetical protein